jgi:hypothetical protein
VFVALFLPPRNGILQFDFGSTKINKKSSSAAAAAASLIIYNSE